MELKIQLKETINGKEYREDFNIPNVPDDLKRAFIYDEIIKMKNKIKQQHTIEGDKRVKMIKAYDKFGGGIKFEADIVGNITNTQISAIRNFMEKTLNNEVDNPVLERQIYVVGVDPCRSDLPPLGRSYTVPQEVKEPNKDKDWEIVSFECANSIYIKGDDGLFRKFGGLFNYTEQDFLRYDKPESFIHSVRRISDGEVFSVGEITKTKLCHDTRIDSFKIENGNIVVYGKWVHGMDGYCDFSDLIKLPLTKEEEPKPVRQMWNRHSGIHDENYVCAHLGCEEYNPLDGRHR